VAGACPVTVPDRCDLPTTVPLAVVLFAPVVPSFAKTVILNASVRIALASTVAVK
jgi:hypothetical protein